MSDLFEFEAQARTARGGAAARRLRREDRVPAVVYGAGKAPVSISLLHKDVMKALEHEAVYSHILTLKTDGKAEKVVLKDVLRNPSQPKVLHVDFYRVSSKEKLTMQVPVHFEGEEEAPGLKDGGVLSKLMTELELSCLPKDLPEYIVVDISKLDMGHAIHLSEIKLPAGVEFLHPVDEEHDQAVVSIHAPKEEEPEELAEEAEAAAGEEASAETADSDAVTEEVDAEKSEKKEAE